MIRSGTHHLYTDRRIRRRRRRRRHQNQGKGSVLPRVAMQAAIREPQRGKTPEISCPELLKPNRSRTRSAQQGETRMIQWLFRKLLNPMACDGTP
jgi:hypothetical protein